MATFARWPLWILNLLLFPMLISCGESQGTLPIDGATKELQIGIGIQDFNAVSDGDDVPLVRGSQGGVHIDVAFRLYGLDPEGARLEIDAFDAGSGESVAFGVSRNLTRSRLRLMEDHWLRTGDQVGLNIFSPDDLTEGTIRVDATVEERNGVRTSATVELRVVR
ncbi:MAG: hypothetical protein AAF411_28215 [Myxococcota bacterium]